MGKFSQIFSCSCLTSSSPPSHSTSPQSSSQLPQQSPNAGPSTSTQQPPNAGPSTSTSTSTTTPAQLDSFLQQFNDISQLHHLVNFIEDLLKNASGEKGEERCTTSQESSYIEGGQTFLEFADKHITKLPGEMKSSIDGLSAETSTILINLLKGAGKIHWVGVALSVVGFVLAKCNQMSDNKRECFEILRDMANLGEKIIDLNEQMPEKKQKLMDAVKCIIVGCSICTSQLSTCNIFRFLTSSVNADTINDFKDKIHGLYSDLQLMAIVDVQKRLPKNAPQSQELYARPEAVGIETPQEKVIKLLDLSAQHTPGRVVVVVHGFGGIGKSTLADAVYSSINLQEYEHSRIHMEPNCSKNDIRALQQQILFKLFKQNVKLENCDQGRGMIRLLSKQNERPLFLYIDNGLKSTDLQQLLPAEDLGDWLPVKSRILVTTRNLHETDLFVSRNVQRYAYSVIPLPNREGREILLKKVPHYNIVEESYIESLLQLCGGVPLLLELTGSQLAINSKSRENIVLKMLHEGEKVGEEDISDRMVDFVYGRLLRPVKEAFMLITTSLYNSLAEKVMLIVGEQEFRALEDASFVKRDGLGGRVIIHDIVRARGEKMSEEEGKIIIRESSSKCLEDEEKLQKVKVIHIVESPLGQPPIEINASHLNCMSDSLTILDIGNERIKFQGKCRKPFKKLKSLDLRGSDISELPMEFEKLEQLAYYCGPLTEEMSLYELPPRLRWMTITNIISSENGDAYSRIPAKLTPPPSLVRLTFDDIQGMERLPNGVEKLTMLEKLEILDCPNLKELPSKIGDLSNLEEIVLRSCPLVEELPSSSGDLSKLKTLDLDSMERLPNGVEKLTMLEKLKISDCQNLNELPSKIGDLSNLKNLEISSCDNLKELTSKIGDLSNLKNLLISYCLNLKELPSKIGDLSNLEEIELRCCPLVQEWPSSLGDLSKLKRLVLYQCSSKLKESLPSHLKKIAI